ncbi:MAG: GumC family protein [Terriglobales bacterium]
MEQQQNETPTISVQDLLPILRRRRWWIIAPLVAGWAITLGITWFLPKKYKSDSLILIQQQRVPEQYVTPNVTSDLQRRLQTMSEQILSRTRLLHIIETFHLYSDKPKSDQDLLVEQMRKDISLELVTTSKGRREADVTGFRLSYSGSTAQLAQQVNGELVSMFIEENLKTRTQMSEDTTSFLGNQLEDARKKLDAQEQRLREFRTQNLGELPDQLQSNLQILSGLQGRLQASTDTLNRAEQQKLYLESILAQYRSARDQMAAAESANVPMGLPAITDQLTKLRQQLAEIAPKYTPKHPDVIRLQQQIADTEALKKRVETDLRKAKDHPEANASLSDSSNGMSPMAQTESQLKAVQLEIQNDRKQVQDLSRQLEQYQARLNLTPIREQQLASIIRDHSQSRETYESLLKKMQQSEVATNLEKRQQGETFQVIDPPSIPQHPYWPNRLTFSLIGIAVGLGLGLAVVAGMELIDPRLTTQNQVKNWVQPPIVVAIPGLWTEPETNRRRATERIQVAAASVLVAIVPIGTLIAFFTS